MSKRVKVAARIGLAMYVVICFVVVLSWSLSSWKSMKHETYTVEEEYILVGPSQREWGDKGAWNCDNGTALLDGGYTYPCDILAYQEPYTLEDRIFRQIAIWTLGPMCAIFVFAVFALGFGAPSTDRERTSTAQ